MLNKAHRKSRIKTGQNWINFLFIPALSCFSSVLVFLIFIPHQVDAATLSLSPASTNLQVGQQTTLNVNLDPQGESVIGVDALLSYNPSHLKIISVFKLDLFSGIPAVQINNQSGHTRFALTHNYGVFARTPGPIAAITLEGLSLASNTPLSLQFQPGITTDSNVAISEGRDALTSASNASLTITQPNTDSPPDPTPTTTPDLSPTPTPSPKKDPPGLSRAPQNPANADVPSASPSARNLAPGFVSPLGNGPQSPPTQGKVLGETNPAASTSSFQPLPALISFLLALFIMSAIIWLKRHRRTAQPLQQSTVLSIT